MESNKPSESDASETPKVDVMSEDEFKEEFSDLPEESEAGDENVLGSHETDSEEESQGQSDNIFLTKEELESLVGREIKDKEDFSKHYSNLKSFVGKKEEKVEKKSQPRKSQDEVMDKLNRIEFFGEHPEAKKYFDDFVKPMADGKGISYEDAYSQVKPYIQATEAQEKEKEIGVESRTRLEPAVDKKLQSLANKAREGDKRAQEEYVRQVLVKKAGF